MSRTTMSILVSTLLAAACSSSPAGGTCERRDECMNLDGLTVAECTAIEETYFDTLSGSDRSMCEAALAVCLEGEICDDFRECQANIDRTVCPCPNVFVNLVDPVEGQMITTADDVDPAEGGIQYDFVIETGCLEDLEQVELQLLAPVDSSYGFGLPDMSGRAVIRTPLIIPGEHRFVVRGVTTSVMSAEVTIDVSP